MSDKVSKRVQWLLERIKRLEQELDETKQAVLFELTLSSDENKE